MPCIAQQQPMQPQQQTGFDTTYAPVTEKEKAEKKLANKEANKAALMSAILPGLGQVYNHKYWKPPILYAGFAVCGYLIYDFSKSFKEYKNAYILRTDGNPANDDVLPQYTPDQIKILRDDSRRYMNLNIAIVAGIYTLNIIDAYVDAHLKEFEINDNLSLHIRPLFYATNYSHLATGLNLTLRFK